MVPVDYWDLSKRERDRTYPPHPARGGAQVRPASIALATTPTTRRHSILKDEHLIRTNDLLARTGDERLAVVEEIIALDLAGCVASGEPWLGTLAVPVPGAVAYLGLESGLAAERLRLMQRSVKEGTER